MMRDIVEKLPSVMIERPKMPRSTWEALRAHILRERLRKKQEQEQTQEFERQKKEREHQKKQEALTLEETKDQIAQLELKLNQHKEEKHQLFHTLKKVLYEDETKRRSKEVPHPHLYLQPSSRPGGSGHNPANASLYMKPHPHILMPASGAIQAQVTARLSAPPAPAPQAATKRPKSPSPVRTTTFYRPPSGPGMTIPSSSGVPTKYVIYTTTAGGVQNTHIPSTAIYQTSSGAPVLSAPVPRPAHLPAHYAAYPGSAGGQIHHSRLAEGERKQQQQQIYLTNASANVARSIAHERQQQVAAVAAQMQVQQRAAAFANAHHQQQQQQQAPPAAHSVLPPGYRPGSIVTGLPRYPVSTTGSLTVTSGSLNVPPRAAHSGQAPMQTPQSYYRE